MKRTIIFDKRGMALISVYMVLSVLIIMASTFFWRSFNEYKTAQRYRDELKAFYIAEAGLVEATRDIFQLFQPLASNAWRTGTYVATFNTVLANYAFASNRTTPEGLAYTVSLPANPIIPTGDGLLLRMIAVGNAPYLNGAVRKIIAATVAYEMEPSPIFDYAYFINNYGWLWGGGITVNGHVRSNGNMSFNGNPMVNGDIFASLNPVLGAAGTITGNSRNLDIPHYQNQAPGRARPMNPTDPTDPSGTVYDAGYDGTSTRYSAQEVMDMPYLGDLTAYRNLATSKNGKITQGGNVIVNNVYDYGAGPDGIMGTADDVNKGPDGVGNTPDDGTLVLIGTAANPIRIDGPVVVQNDIIIKGVIEGQGTIYAGRNIHIIGDITYKNPPAWLKPDADPTAAAAANSAADFVGLAAKGNVILGDYTKNSWKVNCGNYLKPPFTQAYDTEPTDSSLGYDSDNNPANGYRFNGDYTAFDGGSKDNGAGNPTQRRFYEASISDSQMGNIAAPANQIRNLDCVIYNNHALAGQVGKFAINGAIVCRDEAIVYSGSIDINYDVRAYGSGIESIDIFLPRTLALPEEKSRQSS